MLATLYSILLRRRRQAFPPQLASEMLTAFQDAREDAVKRGLLAYLRFGARELAGVAWPAQGARLQASPRSSRLRWVASGALVGGVIAGVLAYTIPATYISSAALRFGSPSIPERFVPSLGRPDMKRQLQKQVMVVLSRRSLTEMIRTHNLYRSELSRMPLEDVIEKMRKDISVRAGSEDTVQISFTYSDPQGTLRVTRELMTRLMDASMRERSEEMKAISMFLTDRAEASAKAWTESIAALRRMKESEPQYPRAQLDVELARKEYQTMSEKSAEVRMAAAAAAWKYDSTLEVLDLPFLPEQELLNRPLVVATGVFAGMLLGLLIAWLRSVRPIDLMVTAPTSA